MSDYVTLDLREIAAQLGDHFNPDDADATCGQCPACRDSNVLSWVSQEEDRCGVCGVQVVWKNSKLWKSIFGSPEERIRQIRAIPAATQSGKHLHQGAGVQGWASQQDAIDWQRAVQMYGDLEMSRIVDYVLSKHTGFPALRHAVNIAKKKVREGVSARQPAQTYLPADGPAEEPPALNIVTGKDG